MIKLSVVKVDSTMGQEWHQYVGSAVCRKENVNREFMVYTKDLFFHILTLVHEKSIALIFFFPLIFEHY